MILRACAFSNISIIDIPVYRIFRLSHSSSALDTEAMADIINGNHENDEVVNIQDPHFRVYSLFIPLTFQTVFTLKDELRTEIWNKFIAALQEKDLPILDVANDGGLVNTVELNATNAGSDDQGLTSRDLCGAIQETSGQVSEDCLNGFNTLCSQDHDSGPGLFTETEHHESNNPKCEVNQMIITEEESNGSYGSNESSVFNDVDLNANCAGAEDQRLGARDPDGHVQEYPEEHLEDDFNDPNPSCNQEPGSGSGTCMETGDYESSKPEHGMNQKQLISEVLLDTSMDDPEEEILNTTAPLEIAVESILDMNIGEDCTPIVTNSQQQQQLLKPVPENITSNAEV